MEIINATWNDPQVEGGWSGPIYRVRATDIASVRPRILVDVSASTTDEAWAKAMRACAESVEAEMGAIDHRLAWCAAETERLRQRRLRIVDVIERGIETDGGA